MANINFSRFSPEVLRAIEAAAQMALSLGSGLVSPGILLASVVNSNSSVAASILQSKGADFNGTMQNVAAVMQRGIVASADGSVNFDDDTLEVFEKLSQRPHVSLGNLTEALLWGPLEQCITPRCQTNGPGAEQQYADLQALNRPRRQMQSTQIGPTVKRYCSDMLEIARSGKYKRAIGRDKEMSRVFLILARSSKNNPVLVGEPGTGKTAIAEELAIRLTKGDVPPELSGLKLFCLDWTALSVQDDSTSILKSIIEEAAQSPDLVLFIDEIHMLISQHADNEVANLLKPAMARGEIKILGATTNDEYQRIESDSALERRFQKVIVDEPDVESAIKILESSKSRYEGYHGVKISSEICREAVNFSVRYITNRRLPDKAFDLIDEAAANLRISNESRCDINVNDLKTVVAEWTGIPVADMCEDDVHRLINIENVLHESVISQDKAVKAVSDAIKRSRMGFGDPNRPIGSFLFLGPTGTGKTELCRALARFLFKDEEKIVRLDMSEYQQEHSASRLFGAPPGYVGYEQGGQLTEAVRRKPYSVVLFDEIEKAHPKIFETLFQVLDDGRMTDGQGRLVNFKNTIVVMTSNLGDRHIMNSLGNANVSDYTVERCKEEVLRQMRLKMPDAFINRIDNVVMFMPLSFDDVLQIASINLKKEQRSLKERGIDVEISEEVEKFIAERGYNPEFGARPVKRAITDYFINPLTNKLIHREVLSSLPIKVMILENKLHFYN